ncbi:MAG: hypothetical protein WCK88_01260 [bacterium]
MTKKTTNTPKKDSIFTLLKPYSLFVAGLLFFTIVSNGLNLMVPKIISSAIDTYTGGKLNMNGTMIEFFIVAL